MGIAITTGTYDPQTRQVAYTVEDGTGTRWNIRAHAREDNGRYHVTADDGHGYMSACTAATIDQACLRLAEHLIDLHYRDERRRKERERENAIAAGRERDRESARFLRTRMEAARTRVRIGKDHWTDPQTGETWEYQEWYGWYSLDRLDPRHAGYGHAEDRAQGAEEILAAPKGWMNH